MGNLSTPIGVKKLQMALHAKAKAEAGYRFYALYDKIYRGDVLAHAYAQCRSNKGAPGVDRQDFAEVEAYGVQKWLGELALALRHETYQPNPIRRAFIPKANSKLRPLRISTLRDRVCMTTAMLRERQQIGMFSTLGSSALMELFAGCGFDWILIDTEHSPNELPNVIAQLQALVGTGVAPVVRPAWNDMVQIKRILDAGAQTLLIPSVRNAEEVGLAVSYTRYPPEGVRGVSGSSRAARYGLNTQYLRSATEEICLLVQIETPEGLDNLEAIANVEGVDAVFIGPADLAAAMGHLGDAQHPEVQAAVDDGFRRLRKLQKPAGYLTLNEAEAQKRIAEGIEMVGIATDTSIITRSALGLTSRIKPK